MELQTKNNKDTRTNEGFYCALSNTLTSGHILYFA